MTRYDSFHRIWTFYLPPPPWYRCMTQVSGDPWMDRGCGAQVQEQTRAVVQCNSNHEAIVPLLSEHPVVLCDVEDDMCPVSTTQFKRLIQSKGSLVVTTEEQVPAAVVRQQHGY